MTTENKIINVSKTEDENVCMAIMIDERSKSKIQSFISTQIDWSNDYGYGNVSVQMPRDGGSEIYIAGECTDSVLFYDDVARDNFLDFVVQIFEEAEPLYKQCLIDADEMKFERNLFGISLNNVTIAKYVHEYDSDHIEIRAVDTHDNLIDDDMKIEFYSKEDFQTWLDRIYDADGEGYYCHYQDATLVSRTLNYMQFGVWFPLDETDTY